MNKTIYIKTQEEIEIMKQGAKILAAVLEELGQAIQPGISTFELDQMAEKTILSHKGATPGFKGYQGFPASICASINEEVVHGIPQKDRILKEGDIIGVDCGVYYKNMYTDACRTFLVGDVSPEVRHFVKITKKALKNAIKCVKPGNRIGDISAAIQKTLEIQQYSPVIECTGHGVGRNLHEPPDIFNAGEPHTGPVMEAGMIFAIEPIAAMGSGEVVTAKDGWTVLTADNTLSAHFEHTVLVTEKGHEVLV